MEKVKRLVAFAILMENGEGIISKAPSYILEKYRATMDYKLEYLIQLLDSMNQAKFRRYLKVWKINDVEG